MDKYYYLISQLPMLVFGREMPLQLEVFLRLARRWLSRSDFRKLALSNLRRFEPDSKGSGVWQSFQEFEYQLRSDVSAWRSSEEKEGDVRPSGFPVSVLREGNPLEIEIRLLKLRWDLLDETEKSHHFDLGFVVIYYLKLQILQLLSGFDKQKGKTRFHRLVYETPLTGEGSGVGEQANQEQEEQQGSGETRDR